MNQCFMMFVSIFMAFQLFASEGERILLYQNSFDAPDNIPELVKGGKYLKNGGVDNSGCLEFSYNNQDNNAMTVIPLDAKLAAGRKLVIRAEIKAKDIGTPKKRYLGPKLMIAYTCMNEMKSWPGTLIDLGTYDYKEFSRMIRIPFNVKNLDLCIGMQQCTGTIWFDNISVELLPLSKAAENYKKSDIPLQPVPRFRGVMISPHRMRKGDWKDMDDLSKWNANLIRYQMSPDKKDLAPEEYIDWLKSELPHIDKCLEKCRRYGMKMVIDLHRGPGTKKNKYGSNILSWNKESQQILIEMWKIIAGHFKGNEYVYAYEILNEPRESGNAYNPNEMDWYELTPIVAKEIRKIDPDTPIIISPLDWSSPNGFYSLKPYNIPGLIYTTHMYVPHELTHQGVHGSMTGLPYPGKAAGTYWDKEQLRKSLQPVRDFQLKYNVPIFVGEFSCIRWAPGDSSYNYLKDSIELFEEYGWDWTYHAFREWDGWSVEHGNDPKDHEMKSSTPRKELIIKHMKKNSLKK